MRRWTPPRGRVLVLAPHPDDEAIGCGGALLLHKRRSDAACVIFATDGEKGGAASERRREARSAARRLGVERVEFWGLPDGGLRRDKRLAALVEEALARLKPRVVYRPAENDAHADHRALSLAARRALRGRAGIVDCRYEVWAAKKPTELLDITALFERKLGVLSVYRSQKASVDPASLARRLNASRGLLLPGALWAEGYRVRAASTARASRRS